MDCDKISSNAMDPYRILPHPADGKFEAYGATLEEAFANAALATASLMWDWRAVASRTSYAVRVRARNRKQLLMKFLGEVIYLLETKSFLLAGVTGLTIDEEEGSSRIEAIFHGDTVSDRYEVFGNVKAITYNEMNISETDGRLFTIQAVVDM
jgi:SHS2 domain-containing protein